LRPYVRPVDALAHERWPRWFPRREFQTVVSRRHFFSMAPDWRHVRATMMVDLADLRGFVGERR